MAGLLARINKIGVKGAGVDFSPPGQSEANQPTPSLDEILKSRADGATEALRPFVESYTRQAAELPESERETKLIYALSRYNADAVHALTYVMIFGSQIELLQTLHERRTVEREEIVKKFEYLQEKFPEVHKERSLDDWLDFLDQRKLIEQKSGTCAITSMGRDFLEYIHRARLSLNRFA